MAELLVMRQLTIMQRAARGIHPAAAGVGGIPAGDGQVFQAQALVRIGSDDPRPLLAAWMIVVAGWWPRAG